MKAGRKIIVATEAKDNEDIRGSLPERKQKKALEYYDIRNTIMTVVKGGYEVCWYLNITYEQRNNRN